jgi:hypothetical protein
MLPLIPIFTRTPGASHPTGIPRASHPMNVLNAYTVVHEYPIMNTQCRSFYEYHTLQPDHLHSFLAQTWSHKAGFTAHELVYCEVLFGVMNWNKWCPFPSRLSPVEKNKAREHRQEVKRMERWHAETPNRMLLNLTGLAEYSHNFPSPGGAPASSGVRGGSSMRSLLSW